MTIKQALISVSDKRGVLEFARGLAAQGVKLLSTGGTAKMLRDAGLTVTEIGDYTGFPEMLDGRVKTLHPKVHGGILARRDLPEHLATIAAHGIPTIDLVCVNLYPFRETVAKPGVTLEDAIENIDIGGPAMVRSSAKNYAAVAIVTDPADYAPLLAEMQANAGALKLETRFGLAKKAFVHTARYDSAIANWLTALESSAEEAPKLSPVPDRLPDRLRPRRNPALRREPAPAGRLLPRPGRHAGHHRRLHPVAGQGTVLQQHRRLRRRLGMRQDLRRVRPASSSSTPTRAASPSMASCSAPMKRPSRPIRPRLSAASSPSTAPSMSTSSPP